MLSKVFRRSFETGWLILSGSSPTIEDRGLERLLAIADLQPLLILKSGEKETPGLDQWVEDLGAILEVQHMQLEIESIEDSELETHLERAGMLFFYGGHEAKWLTFLGDYFIPLLDEAGGILPAVMWFVGSATLPLGEWIYSSSLKEGGDALGLLPGCLILQESGDLGELEPVQRILRTQTRSYALNLVSAATIALGPQGEIDLWGSPSPSILLGQGWGEA